MALIWTEGAQPEGEPAMRYAMSRAGRVLEVLHFRGAYWRDHLDRPVAATLAEAKRLIENRHDPGEAA